MSVTRQSGETLHLFSTLHPITFSARQPMPSTTHLWLSLMTERASLVTLDVDQLLMAWWRFTWLLTGSGWLTRGTSFAQNHQLIMLVHSGYSAILLEPFDMAWWLLNCLILWLAILSFTYKHLYRHTQQISSKSWTRTGEKRERGLGIWAKGLCSPYWCYSASGTFISWCC